MNSMKIDKAGLDAKMAAFRALCGETGLRVTHQRQEVYRELARAADHPSAEMLHKRVTRRIPTMTLDTVYRTLGTLEEIGLVERMGVIGNSARFEANLTAHHHFVCKGCGHILDVYSERLDRAGLEQELPKGARLHSARVELRGLCQTCAT